MLAKSTVLRIGVVTCGECCDVLCSCHQVVRATLLVFDALQIEPVTVADVQIFLVQTEFAYVAIV